MRGVAYGVGALLTAACGDALVETLQNARAFGDAALDHNHQGVGPALALAAVALLALGGAIVRLRIAGDRGDWLVALARDFDAAAPRTHLIAIVGGALALVGGIEEYERAFGGGAPFAGAAATPLQTISSLAIYVACASVVARALAAFMRGIVATCDALVAVVAAFVAWLDSVSATATSFRGHARTAIARHPSSLHRGVCGDRSPPRLA